MLKKISLVVKKAAYLLIFLFFLSFIFMNTDFVKVNVAPFGYEIQIRIFILVILSFLMGCMFEYFYDTLNISKIRDKIIQRRKFKSMERELKRIGKLKDEK
jgi:uncharacterized integral membrane protein